MFSDNLIRTWCEARWHLLHVWLHCVRVWNSSRSVKVWSGQPFHTVFWVLSNENVEESKVPPKKISMVRIPCCYIKMQNPNNFLHGLEILSSCLLFIFQKFGLLKFSDSLDGRTALQNKLNLPPESVLTSWKEFTKTSSETEKKKNILLTAHRLRLWRLKIQRNLTKNTIKAYYRKEKTWKWLQMFLPTNI